MNVLRLVGLCGAYPDRMYKYLHEVIEAALLDIQTKSLVKRIIDDEERFRSGLE